MSPNNALLNMHPKRNLPNMRLNHALAKYTPNRALVKYASQPCTCQICIPIVHLPDMHPDHALAKYAFQTCTDQICVPSMHLPNMHPSIEAQQSCQELDKNLSETCQNNNSSSGSARTKGGGGTPPRGASIRLRKQATLTELSPFEPRRRAPRVALAPRRACSQL